MSLDDVIILMTTCDFYRAGATMTIIMLLASLNSCTNPWIYIIYIDNFCAKLSKLMRGDFGRSKSFSVFSYKD